MLTSNILFFLLIFITKYEIYNTYIKMNPHMWINIKDIKMYEMNCWYCVKIKGIRLLILKSVKLYYKDMD